MSIAVITPVDLVAPALAKQATAMQAASPTKLTSFSEMLTHGIAATDAKLTAANSLLAQAAVDTSIPLHRVTYAIEEARISFELMIQLRNRLIDASQQLLNMQV